MKDFSLNSGERQTATEISNIRRDHVARYEKAIIFLCDKIYTVIAISYYNHMFD